MWNFVTLTNKTINFCEISKNDFNEWLELGIALWPDYKNKKDELKREFNDILESSKETAFLCKDSKESVAFINLSIRSDYVQGSGTSPVGYVEGIYVNPKYRKQGLAKELIKIAEQWSFKNGCKELGSDAELENINSQKFHKNLGFKEVNRTVNFIKTIDDGLQNIT